MCRKSGRGAQHCWDGQQATKQPLPPASITTRKTLPFPGVGDMGQLAEAEVRVGVGKVSLLLSSTLDPRPTHQWGSVG